MKRIAGASPVAGRNLASSPRNSTERQRSGSTKTIPTASVPGGIHEKYLLNPNVGLSRSPYLRE